MSPAALQRGYKETFEHYHITERKELHHTLTAREWSSETLISMMQVLEKYCAPLSMYICVLYSHVSFVGPAQSLQSARREAKDWQQRSESRR